VYNLNQQDSVCPVGIENIIFNKYQLRISIPFLSLKKTSSNKTLLTNQKLKPGKKGGKR